MTGVSGAVGVASGGRHACVVLGDGRVQCFGDNGGGQLGDGTTTSRASPTQVVDLGAAAEVVAGPSFTCARLRDGTAACWGNNGFRQSSPRADAYITRPEVVAGIARLVQIRVASDAVCGLRDDAHHAPRPTTFHGLPSSQI